MYPRRFRFQIIGNEPVGGALNSVGAGSDPELDAYETDERQREQEDGEEL
jgi:hypothetical protein